MFAILLTGFAEASNDAGDPSPPPSDAEECTRFVLRSQPHSRLCLPITSSSAIGAARLPFVALFHAGRKPNTLGGLPALPLTAMNWVLGNSGATCSIAETKRPEWPMTTR